MLEAMRQILAVAWDVAVGFWGVLSEMAPYLLFGFLMAGALSVFVSPRLVERHLGGGGIWPVLKAAALGVPLPLCSCGVIPVGASLRRHGASRGATTAFLIATPQDGVDSIFVTLSLLGGTFAIFRPLAALVSGVIGGTVVAAADKPNRSIGEKKRACDDACCAPSGGRIRRALAYGFGSLPRDIGRALLVGLVIAAFISVLVPKDYFVGVLGSGIRQDPARAIVGMLIMMALGIPVYVCATASVPVAAALLAAGASPGAALVFLMTGPATNAATIATVWKVMGRRTAILYLATVAVTALAAGLTLDAIVTRADVLAQAEKMWMLPGPVKWLCAAALLGVLGVGIYRSYASRRGGPAAPQRDEGQDEQMITELRVTGMTCDHCRQAVRRALAECQGAESVEVDLGSGVARVAGGADPAELRKAVEGLGYGVEEADQPETAPARRPRA